MKSWINSAGTEAGKIVKMVRETTPEDSEREDEIELLFNNVLHKCRVTVRTLWSKDQKPQYRGCGRSGCKNMKRRNRGGIYDNKRML